MIAFCKGTNLSGGAEVRRGTTGAGVWQGCTRTAAHRGGQSSTGRLRDVGGLTQDAVSLETSPCAAPAEEELIQELNLGGGR